MWQDDRRDDVHRVAAITACAFGAAGLYVEYSLAALLANVMMWLYAALPGLVVHETFATLLAGCVFFAANDPVAVELHVVSYCCFMFSVFYERLQLAQYCQPVAVVEV